MLAARGYRRAVQLMRYQDCSDNVNCTIRCQAKHNHFSGCRVNAGQGRDIYLMCHQHKRVSRRLGLQPFFCLAGLGIALAAILKEGVEKGQVFRFSGPEERCGFPAATPLAGSDPRLCDAVRLKGPSYGNGLLSAAIVQIALGGAVTEPEMTGVAGPGRKGMAHHCDIFA